MLGHTCCSCERKSFYWGKNLELWVQQQKLYIFFFSVCHSFCFCFSLTHRIKITLIFFLLCQFCRSLILNLWENYLILLKFDLFSVKSKWYHLFCLNYIPLFPPTWARTIGHQTFMSALGLDEEHLKGAWAWRILRESPARSSYSKLSLTTELLRSKTHSFCLSYFFLHNRIFSN